MRNLTWCITVASQVLITCSHQIPPAPCRNLTLWGRRRGGRTIGSSARGSVAQLATFTSSCDHSETVWVATAAKHWLRQVGVSILEQKETRIFCQQEPPQLCHGGGAHYPSIHFSVTASPALKVAGRLESMGQGRVTPWTGRLSSKRPLRGTLTYSQFRVSNQHLVHVFAMWTLEKHKRTHTDTETQEDPGWESNPQPCGCEMTMLTAALLCHPGSYYV